MTNLEKPVRRLTRGALDATHGRDRGRRLVASLEVGDLLSIRPAGTRRAEVVSLFDVYRYALVRRVNAARLEKAREKKKQKADGRERRRLRRGISA